MNYLRSLESWDCGFESHSRHVCLRLLCVCICSGLIPRPRNPIDYRRIKKLKWNKTFHGCPMLQSGSNRKKRVSYWSSNMNSCYEIIPLKYHTGICTIDHQWSQCKGQFCGPPLHIYLITPVSLSFWEAEYWLVISRLNLTCDPH
jgi:hypothetical protein